MFRRQAKRCRSSCGNSLVPGQCMDQPKIKWNVFEAVECEDGLQPRGDLGPWRAGLPGEIIFAHLCSGTRRDGI